MFVEQTTCRLFLHQVCPHSRLHHPPVHTCNPSSSTNDISGNPEGRWWRRKRPGWRWCMLAGVHPHWVSRGLSCPVSVHTQQSARKESQRSHFCVKHTREHGRSALLSHHLTLLVDGDNQPIGSFSAYFTLEPTFIFTSRHEAWPTPSVFTLINEQN